MRLVLGTIHIDEMCLSAEQQEVLRSCCFVHGASFTFTEEGKWNDWYKEVIYDLERLPLEWLPHLRIIRGIELPQDPVGAPKMPEFRPATVVNNRVNVAVPGLGLLAIAEAMVEYDLCTDRLNVLLQEGWRILAICPQPDQRRPDYILGKPKQKDDDDEQVRW